MSYMQDAPLGGAVVGKTGRSPVAELVAQNYSHLVSIDERLQSINRRLSGGGAEKNPSPQPVASHLHDNLLMCQQEITSIMNWLDKIDHDLFGE
jgi:hypothetical protein